MKTKILTLFVFFFLCFLFCSWGQENSKLDSLLNVLKSQPEDTLKILTLEALFHEEIYNNPKTAKKYALEAIKLSKKINDPVGEAYANRNLGGGYYQVIGNSDSARYHLKQAITIFKEHRPSKVGYMYGSLAIIEAEAGNYDEAIKYFDADLDSNPERNKNHAGTLGNKSMSYIERGQYEIALPMAITSLKIYDSLLVLDPKNNRLYRSMATASVRVGYAEEGLKNYDSAMGYFERALASYEKVKDSVYIGHTYNDIGNQHKNKKNYDVALAYYEKAMSIAKEKNIKSMQGYLQINIGDSYIKLGQYDKAENTLLKALPINMDLGRLDNVITNYVNLGKLFIEKNGAARAISYLNQAIIIADSTNNLSSLLGAYKQRAIAYNRLGNHEAAFNDQNKYQALNDTIFNAEKSKRIEELRTIYETEKKEQQLALQDKEITVLEQEAKISNQQKLLLGGGLGFSMLALGFGFYGFRQRTRRNQLEKEKVEADLEFKKKELTTHALHLAKKNEVLESVKMKAKELKIKEGATGYQELIKTINFDQQDDKNWESFTQYFEQVHKDFAANVQMRYPDVTKNELRFMALLKMNMSSKEIATILNISPDGIKKARQRLRKKMELTPEISLENTVLAI